jgi:hypothetical protein
LPAFEAVDGTDLGLALVNSDSVDGQVTITLRTYDGALLAGASIVNPYTLNVASGSKVELRLADLFGAGISSQRGWLQIDSSTPSLKAFSFVFDSSLSFVEGVGVTSVTSNQLIFPKVSQESDTTLRIVNTAAQSLDATISLYDNSGNLTAVLPLSLPAFSGVVQTAADLTSSVPGFEGYAVVQSTGSLVGFESYRNQSDYAVIRGVPASGQMKSGYWTQFIAQGGYSSRLAFINTTSAPQVLQVTADSVLGTASVTTTLPPYARAEQSVADIFGISGGTPVTGDLHFDTQTDTPGVIGVLEYSAVDGTLLSTAEPQPQPQTDFYFTHVAEGAGFYTGFAFLNPSADGSTILLDLFDKSGSVRASTTVQLAPGERRVGLIGDLFQEPIVQLGGYVRASTTAPTFAQEMFGSSDSTAFLANVPAQENIAADTLIPLAKANPVPVITSLSPSSALIDNLTSLNIRISGSGFRRASVVNYDGVAISSSLISSSLLAITLTGSQLTPAQHSIQIFTPAPGGGYSSIATLALSLTLKTVSPIALNTTTLVQGQTLTATITYQNPNSFAVTVNQMVLASRPPGGTNTGGPYDNLSPAWGVTTIQPGATLQLSASRTIKTTDPTGTWYAYATYQDTSSTWHDGPDVYFTVSAQAAPPPTNQPPVVNAGSNLSVTLPSCANLTGTASDDGLPSGVLTTTWSMYSGPANVSFGNASALSTTACFTVAGTYVLQLSATDTALTSTSLVTITVSAAPPSGGPVSTGAIYYVSNSGSDSNSGTSQSSPWKTIAKVQSSLSNLKAGDSVLFQRGGIWYEELDINNVNGTSGSPITFGNYGSGNLPVIDGGGTVSGTTVSGGRQWCIGGRSSKMSYVTIDGFECRFTTPYGIAFVNVASGSSGITVQNTYIHDTGSGDTGYYNELFFFESQGGHPYGTKFLNNKVGNCYGHNCIQIHGDTGSPLIRGNECYGFSHNCIDVKYVQGALVDQNVVHDALGTQSPENAYYIENDASAYTADVTWTRNIVYGSRITGAFHCHDAGGPVVCNMYNNTVRAGSNYGVFGSAGNVQIHVKNNIFDGVSPQSGSGFVEWDYNDIVQSTPIGPHDMSVTPQYVNAGANDFHLQSTSPVIDKGVNVGLPYAGSAPDIGAFEYGL